MSSFIAEILDALLPELGATCQYEPEFKRAGYITFKNGGRVFFRDNRFNLNPLGSIRIAQDKGLTNYFLRHFGYAVPNEVTVWRRRRRPKHVQRHRLRDGLRLAEDVGWPLCIKPVAASQGTGIIFVQDAGQMARACRQLLKSSSVIIVQQFIPGRDYRIVVLEGSVISAYERVPLEVMGDGHSCIRELLEDKQRIFEHCGRDTRLKLEDPRMIMKLVSMGIGLQHVPTAGKSIRLMDIANLSTGGTSLDVTTEVHPSVAAVAIEIARDLELNLCGIDIVMDDVSLPLAKYSVLEVNSAPGLDHYAYNDPSVQQDVVLQLYKKVLSAVERRALR